MKPGKELLFLALGGSGEIGMNVNLYGCEGKWIMVDLGMTFADPAYPGIDLILPDLEFIEKRRKDLLALVCDSTNVFQDAASGSEAGVREGLDRVVGEAEGRVLVTTFASNAARLKTLGKVAEDTGRQVCVAGRSLDRILRVAKSVGYL